MPKRGGEHALVLSGVFTARKSKPSDLPPMFPYERLMPRGEGTQPYATGDFAGHRSIYGGAM